MLEGGTPQQPRASGGLGGTTGTREGTRFQIGKATQSLAGPTTSSPTFLGSVPHR